MIKCLTIASILAILTVVSVSRAEAEEADTRPQTAEKFGSARTLVISGDFALAARHYRQPSLLSTTAVTVRPTLDYFIVDHFSLGGAFDLGYSRSDFGSWTSLSVVPRIGYEIPLVERVSLWPTANIAYTRMWSRVADQIGGSWVLSAMASADVIGQLVPHFFVGIGPTVTTRLSQSYDFTPAVGFGVMSKIGGWI